MTRYPKIAAKRAHTAMRRNSMACPNCGGSVVHGTPILDEEAAHLVREMHRLAREGRVRLVSTEDAAQQLMEGRATLGRHRRKKP